MAKLVTASFFVSLAFLCPFRGFLHLRHIGALRFVVDD